MGPEGPVKLWLWFRRRDDRWFRRNFYRRLNYWWFNRWIWVDRNRINYLIRRHGLPREQIVKPAWEGDRLVTEPQWVYRLRDVRDLIARLAA